MNSGFTADVPVASAIRRRAISPSSRTSHVQRDHANNMERALQIAKLIEVSKDSLKNPEQWKSVLRCLLDFFEFLLPSVKENCAKYSTVGCHLRAKNALERLHQPDKTFAITDQIMLPTLGSQEGAFEMQRNFVGDQAQIIRQLIASNTVRRVGLCCLSSPHGKRQHLAVSHEKGKVTILQLSSLLKQADVAKKKLTLSRLASAPISCTIMSLVSNPANEEFLAVCGLKECHVLSFSSTGTVNEHIVITPQLETGNYIKRALWLPGSQTMLAIITCDYVKIYELSEDTYSPQYYFVVPSGKIRDCTFVYQSGSYYLLLFASSGYIYTQSLIDESLAKHGAFYVTNTLEIDHPLIVESKGALGEGGASIYYSHLLQMLFFSYSIGKNFMAPLTDVNEGVKCVMLLQTTPQSKNSSKSTSQALMQWSEVAGHPGLIFAMQNQSNNPVIFMLKPDGILMQEIKYSSAKAKIIDMVAIRHTSGGVERSTLLLLCEDGSLRIFAANPKVTNFWLSPEVQPVANQLYQSFQPKSLRRSKKIGQKNQPGQGNVTSSGQPQFPVDFFEHYTLLHDIDYGGCDLLQIYNTQQLKHRIDTTGLYVVSTRSTGFVLEVINNDSKVVICGFRILIGTQDPVRAPPTVTVYGRVINTYTTRPRWFDIPLTHEESLRSDKKLSILFGPTQDPDKVCMLDCIKVYGKSKELIGWPEESDDAATNANASSSNQLAAVACLTSQSTDSTIQTTITPLDKMLTIMLEVLDSGLGILGASKNEDPLLKKKSIEIATYLLLYPLPNVVQNQAKWVLATLHNNRAAYNAYKDKEILSEVNSELEKLKTVRDLRNIDPEAFFRLVVLARNIAVARPQALTKITMDNQFNIVSSFMVLLKGLYSITPNYELQSSIVRVGLSHTESTIHCLIEIIYAFTLSDLKLVDKMTTFLVELLLDKSSVISHSTKQAMIRLLRPMRIKRRKVMIGTPPDCASPTNKEQQEVQSNEEGAVGGVANDELGAVGPSVQALLGMGGAVGGLPMDLQPDADDETIMEIAIALSLQEHEIPVLQQGLADLQRGIRFPSLNDVEAPPEFFNA